MSLLNCFIKLIKIFAIAKHQPPPPHYTQVYENNPMQTPPPQVYYKSEQYWPSAIDYNPVS